jgi:lipopolysaccharide/colanic/teichoic acid biosynthesis glycosyltransferase
MQTSPPQPGVSLELVNSGSYQSLKRCLDLALSGLLLVALAPVWALCAVAVRLDSPGPILFRQQRAGEGGRIFTMLKFRTMRANADTTSHREYVASLINGQSQPHSNEQGQFYKLVGDPRITPVGHWLRRTSLDELPQLANVLRGEMSLVGPRPPIPYELEHYQPAHLQRLAVKPGITGLWQVSGRSRTTFEEMVKLDLEYISKQSLLLDLGILLKTIPVVLYSPDGH